jgi:hypothetical protein
MELELRLKGKGHMRRPRIRKFSQMLEVIKGRGNNWQETERERL